MRGLVVAFALVSVVGCAHRPPAPAQKGVIPPISAGRRAQVLFTHHLSKQQMGQELQDMATALGVTELEERVEALEGNQCECAGQPAGAKPTRDADCLYNCSQIGNASERTKCERRCPPTRITP